MGYDSSFNLSFRKADGGAFSHREAKEIHDAVVKMNDEPDEFRPSLKDEHNYPSTSIDFSFCEAHWYDAKQQFDKFMAGRPDLILEYCREGEDREDVDEFTWKGGEAYDTGPRTYRTPLPDGDTLTVGWIDRSCATFRMVAVPRSQLMEALQIIRKDHPDATVLRALDFYGEVEPFSQRGEDMVLYRLMTFGIRTFIDGKESADGNDAITVPLDIYGYKHTMCIGLMRIMTPEGEEIHPKSLTIDGKAVHFGPEVQMMLEEFLAEQDGSL